MAPIQFMNLRASYLSYDSIAHVPQSIYLTDRSIAENIAIGMHFDDINMQKVKEVSL